MYAGACIYSHRPNVTNKDHRGRLKKKENNYSGKFDKTVFKLNKIGYGYYSYLYKKLQNVCSLNKGSTPAFSN